MRRCLQLAENAVPTSMPNPNVGAVLVYQNRIIGEGHTSYYGGAHAEVNCIRSVSKKDQSLIPHSTLFVTLEPCSHFGKTPPCANLIIEHHIKKVVIGISDPNPKVAGKGIKLLQQAGVEIILGVLEEACRYSMRKFLCPIQNNRPFVTIKWAESSNHKISNLDGSPIPITGKDTQIFTHKNRSEHQAILCGWKTIYHDRPKLDNRLWAGNSPQVIIMDPNQQLNGNDYFQKHPEWWRIVRGNSERLHDISIEKWQLQQILNQILLEGIQSIYIEGGAYTIQQFIDEKIWDECFMYQNHMLISEGLCAPQLTDAKLIETFHYGDDTIYHYIPSF